jgi:hypothetical protein
MQIENRQFGLNRRQQRKQSSLFSLFAPVPLILVLAIVCMCVCDSARGDCYVDPLTGRQVCVPAGSGWQPLSGGGAPRPTAPQASAESSAHCRISVADGNTGSGTLIGFDNAVGLVLTCAHLFDGSTERIVVSFPDGSRFAARMIERDRAHDLAALVIQPPHRTPIAVSDVDPSGVLAACGFGPNGQFRCVQGGVTGWAVAMGATHPALTIRGAVRPGDSGGGVLDARGRLVGVVWGQREGLTYATCGRPVREFLDRIRGRVGRRPSTADGARVPAVPQVDWEARFSAITQQFSAMDAKKQDKGDYLRAGDLNGYLRIEDAPKILADQYARRTDVEGELTTLSTKFESVHSRVESVRRQVEQVAASKGGFFQGLSFGKLVVGALGLSGPLAAAVVVAGGLAGRRIKSRVKRRESRAGKMFGSGPIAVDSPPPPQPTVPETHYVSVEQDTFAKAHQWASEHVARKYPGATEILQALESLIKQYLASH